MSSTVKLFTIIFYKDKKIFLSNKSFFIFFSKNFQIFTSDLFYKDKEHFSFHQIFFNIFSKSLSQLVTLQSPVLSNDWDHTGVKTFRFFQRTKIISDLFYKDTVTFSFHQIFFYFFLDYKTGFEPVMWTRAECDTISTLHRSVDIFTTYNAVLLLMSLTVLVIFSLTKIWWLFYFTKFKKASSFSSFGTSKILKNSSFKLSEKLFFSS
jgi:hypothetical protein